MAIKKGYNFHQSFGLRQFLFISDSSGSNEISDVHLISSLKARQRVKVRHKTGWNICKIMLGKVSKVVARQEKLVWSWNRFSAKEGASRSDQARPRTNMQVPTDTSCFEEKGFQRFPSDIGREVWWWKEWGPWQVQREGGGQTQSSQTSDQHPGLAPHNLLS